MVDDFQHLAKRPLGLGWSFGLSDLGHREQNLVSWQTQNYREPVKRRQVAATHSVWRCLRAAQRLHLMWGLLSRPVSAELEHQSQSKLNLPGGIGSSNLTKPGVGDV
jgi:hypothetical protein